MHKRSNVDGEDANDLLGPNHFKRASHAAGISIVGVGCAFELRLTVVSRKFTSVLPIVNVIVSWKLFRCCSHLSSSSGP